MKTKVLIFAFCFFAIVGELYSQSWQILNASTTANILEVKFINPNTGFISCNDGKIKKTTDAGTTWNTVLNQSIILSSLYFVNENTGFAVGSFGKVFKTNNGGLNWTSTTPTSFKLNSVYFIDAITGYIVGDHGTILKTINGGLSWFSQTSPIPDVRLSGIAFSNNIGYISVLDIVTNLFFTTNAGNTWQDGKVRSGVVVGSSIVFNGESGYLAGYEYMASSYNPLIFTTENNGQTWHEYRSQSLGQLYDVAVSPTDPNKVCAIGRYDNDPQFGNQGLIMRTINGGESWSEEQWAGSVVDLISVCATTTDFYVVGYAGIILKTGHTVGISTVNSSIPNGFSLSQNFPNPFNPSTKINFSIPKSGNVTLSVYNTTGKEIKVLINQSLSVGNYNYDFDATNLTSGVYFYTLQAEGLKDTKRMVLLK